MSPELQLQYLDAMGIQLWQSRKAETISSLVEDVADISATETQQQNTPEANVMEQPVSVEENHQNIQSQLQQAAVQQKDLQDNDLQRAPSQQISGWEQLIESVTACTACELLHNRKTTVIAEGSDQARFMFVMVAPSAQAEAGDKFLSQESSELFSKMLNAIGLGRQQIYLTSLLKCPLESNRDPRTTELICCEDYLRKQLELVKPELIIAMGETVAQHLLVSKQPLDELRQKSYQYQNTPVMAMPHPDDLLVKPEDKRKAWHDLQKIQREYNV